MSEVANSGTVEETMGAKDPTTPSSRLTAEFSRRAPWVTMVLGSGGLGEGTASEVNS